VIRYLVLAAIAGGVAHNNIARADDNRHGDSGWSQHDKQNDPGSSSPDPKASRSSGSQGSTSPPSVDQLSKDYRQIQADFQQIQKDCDDGDYGKAQTDLNQLIQHRQKYYSDIRASSNSSDSTPTAAAPSIRPTNSPGKN